MRLNELYDVGVAEEERAYVARITEAVRCPDCGSAGHVTPSDQGRFFCFRCSVEFKEAA